MVFDRFQLFLSVVLVVLNGPTGDLPQILPRGFLGSTFGSERCALDTLDVHKERTTAAWGLFLSKKGGGGYVPAPLRYCHSHQRTSPRGVALLHKYQY